MAWKKGKIFRKNGRKMRYIYRNGRKATKKLVYVGTWPAVPAYRYAKKKYRGYRGRRR